MNKGLIKQRFKNSLDTYNQEAQVQVQMASTLIEMLPKHNFNTILEIGCGSGLLTKKCLETITYKQFIANDIVPECESYIKTLNNEITFLPGDITGLELTTSFDLIISNAVFQWFEEPFKTIRSLKKHLTSGGILAFSTFGERNFYELREILNIGLEYPKYENIFNENFIEIEFSSSLELLKHIKNTGANAITNYVLSKNKLKELDSSFIKRYGKIKLTYHTIFSIDHVF